MEVSQACWRPSWKLEPAKKSAKKELNLEDDDDFIWKEGDGFNQTIKDEANGKKAPKIKKEKTGTTGRVNQRPYLTKKHLEKLDPKEKEELMRQRKIIRDQKKLEASKRRRQA